MPVLKPRRTYALVLCAASLPFLVKFAVLPLTTQSYAVSISPVLPQAEPGPATADLLANFSAQNFTVKPLDYVAHPYLTGRGTLVGFAGDNIQIFEYPTSAAAHDEALAIFGRAPRTAAESYFHLFLRANLIGLYFGHNAEVLAATEEMMGPPIVVKASSSVR